MRCLPLIPWYSAASILCDIFFRCLCAKIKGNNRGKHRQKLLPADPAANGQCTKHRRHGQRHQAFDAQ